MISHDDLFGPEPEPKNHFVPHQIIVATVAYEEEAGQFSIEPTVCVFAIDHGRCELRDYQCIVEDTCNELGLHAALFGVFDKDHRIEATTYCVRPWVSKYDVPGEPVEWDAGIDVIDCNDMEE